MAGRLNGKVAVVTGATSGIGQAAAVAFAREGAAVVAFGRRREALDSVAAALGPGHHAIGVDVSDEASVEAAFQQVAKLHGRIDVLYNCAGVQLVDRDAPVDALDLATWRETLDTNLTGVFLTSKFGIPLMLPQHRGSIIHCGSPTGLSGRGWRYHASSSSKGGLVALTKAMANAYGPQGLRVNLVVPGTIATGMTAGILDNADRAAELMARTALRRLGTPEDLTGIAVFLASDESAYATGGVFVVDGGLLIT